jgi:hypothetical protein
MRLGDLIRLKAASVVRGGHVTSSSPIEAITGHLMRAARFTLST